MQHEAQQKKIKKYFAFCRNCNKEYPVKATSLRLAHMKARKAHNADWRGNLFCVYIDLTVKQEEQRAKQKKEKTYSAYCRNCNKEYPVNATSLFSARMQAAKAHDIDWRNLDCVSDLSIKEEY